MRLLNNKAYSQQTNTKTKRIAHRESTPIDKDNSSGQQIVKKERPSELSRSEIRDRVEAHKKEKAEAYKVTLNAKKAAIQAKSPKVKESVKEEIAKATKAEVEITPEGEPFGDIKKNDPNDSDTHEKLKGVLTSGMINFSDKEREVLGKILS